MSTDQRAALRQRLQQAAAMDGGGGAAEVNDGSRGNGGRCGGANNQPETRRDPRAADARAPYNEPGWLGD